MFDHGGAKFTSCPGRHLTSLRPWISGHDFPKHCFTQRAVEHDTRESSHSSVDQSTKLLHPSRWAKNRISDLGDVQLANKCMSTWR